jgi:hypothetical protein
MNNAQYGSIRLQSSGSRVTTFFALGVAATVIIVLCLEQACLVQAACTCTQLYLL